MKRTRLDLGCGSRKQSGYIGLDIRSIEGVDVICDLNRSIPLPDNVVSNVYANHVFEHLTNFVGVMQEIYRICLPGALVRVRVPYFKSTGAFSDPTHRCFFAESTWQYFDRQSALGSYYEWGVDFAIEGIDYDYKGRIFGSLSIWPWLQRYLRGRLWDAVSSMSVQLRVCKPVRLC